MDLGDIIDLLENLNLTIVNRTDNITQVIHTVDTTTGGALLAIFWLALVITGFFVSLRVDGFPRFLVIALFIISIFVGLVALAPYGLGAIALLIGILGIAIGSISRRETVGHGNKN